MAKGKTKNRLYKQGSWSSELQRKGKLSGRTRKYHKINMAKARAARLAAKTKQTAPDTTGISHSGHIQSICNEVPPIASTSTACRSSSYTTRARHSPRAARRPQRQVKGQSSNESSMGLSIDSDDHVSSLHCYGNQYN